MPDDACVMYLVEKNQRCMKALELCWRYDKRADTTPFYEWLKDLLKEVDLEYKAST